MSFEDRGVSAALKRISQGEGVYRNLRLSVKAISLKMGIKNRRSMCSLYSKRGITGLLAGRVSDMITGGVVLTIPCIRQSELFLRLSYMIPCGYVQI